MSRKESARFDTVSRKESARFDTVSRALLAPPSAVCPAVQLRRDLQSAEALQKTLQDAIKSLQDADKEIKRAIEKAQAKAKQKPKKK